MALNKYPVLYVYKHTDDNGKELRYSIRSLKNLKNWNGEIFVTGDSERWFKDITYIKAKARNSNPYMDAEAKILTALNDPRLPDDFILMNDDIYITKPLDITYLHQNELERTGGGYHNNQKEVTKKWLLDNGYTALNYDLHTPMLMNKQKRLHVNSLIRNTMAGVSLKPRSVYGNVFNVGGEYYQDAKTKTAELPKAPIISTQFYTAELQELFPETSKYEAEDNTSVSVVIPVHNQEKLIIKALDSIPNHKAIKEVIVCDDGSTDNTVKAVKGYKKRPVILLENKENKSVGYSFNRLLDEATGDYILRLDSDDTFSPEMTKVLDQLDGSDIIYFNMVDNDGRVRRLTNTTKMLTVANCHLFKRSFIGTTRTIDGNWGEDRHLLRELQKKRPTELFTNVNAYNYNYPREGSLTDRVVKRKAGNFTVKDPTLNLFTNCHLGCTTDPTIFDTYENYCATFGKPEKVDIYCDPNPNPDLFNEYSKQIKAYFGKDPIKTTGLADGYRKSLETDSEYIFQLEADWSFQNINHTIQDIVREMHKDDLWFMLFNQHKNQYDPKLRKWQTYFKPSESQLYCWSDRVSNNPHIINIAYYKKHIVPLIDWTIGGSGRIEQELETKFNIAIYGVLGQDPTIKHEDMRRGV
ncbi:glycosyltransferase family 2 protein, partial [Candidatus Saccharibacteria bacterium]|nr:glycosyltransferase family 2 protein [Candidatus Saccharibacteria bacterium]